MFLHGREHLIKLLEPCFPDLSILFHPFVDLFHFFDLKRVVDLPPLLFLLHKFAFGKYPQMFRNGLPRGIEMLRNGVRRHRLQSDQSNNCSSRRVCNGLENVSFHDCEKIMQPNGCRCKREGWNFLKGGRSVRIEAGCVFELAGYTRF